jgi:hypothetical protein
MLGGSFVSTIVPGAFDRDVCTAELQSNFVDTPLTRPERQPLDHIERA